MKYKCTVCNLAGKEPTCILNVTGEDYQPEFCPFDNTTVRAVWAEIPGTDSNVGSKAQP